MCQPFVTMTLNKFCMFQNVEVEEEHVDERSVDDLLSFINGADGGKSFLLLFFFFFFFN